MDHSRWQRALAGAAWRRARAAVLARDDHRCRDCGAVAQEVNHQVPLHAGGAPFDPANLRGLCRACHIAVHRGIGLR